MQCLALPSPQGSFSFSFSWLNLAGWLFFKKQKWLKPFFFFFFSFWWFSSHQIFEIYI